MAILFLKTLSFFFSHFFCLFIYILSFPFLVFFMESIFNVTARFLIISLRVSYIDIQIGYCPFYFLSLIIVILLHCYGTREKEKPE